MEIYYITILILIILLLGHFLIQQILLNEKFLEDKIYTENIITNLDEIIDEIGIKLDIIDTKGSFKSDDEIGWFFTDIKTLNEMLSEYKNI